MVWTMFENQNCPVIPQVWTTCEVEIFKFNSIPILQDHWNSKCTIFNEHCVILMYEAIEFGALCFYWIWWIPFMLFNFKNVLELVSIPIKISN